MVDREKFGNKRVCPACGCKFYNMHRDPPTCPRCGVDVSQVYEPEEEELQEEELLALEGEDAESDQDELATPDEEVVGEAPVDDEAPED